MSATSKEKKAWLWEMAAIAMALLGFVARCLPWRFVFSEGSVIMPGVDPYYHLWRATHLVQSFPLAPLVDPYISFPKGGSIPWPPGFDLMIALPGLLGAPTSFLAAWGAVLMPALGALGVWLVWVLGKKIFDRPTGLLAAAFTALSIGFIHYSKIGRIDHHALVAPMCLGICISFLNALQNREHSRLWSLLGAALAAVALGSWIVTPPIYFTPVALMLMLHALKGDDHKASTPIRWGILTAVVLSALVVFWAGNPGDNFSLYRPSILHLLAYAGFAILGLASLKGKKWLVLTCAFLLAFGILVLLLVPQLASPIKTAIEVASGGSSTYSMAMESSSLLFPKHTFSLMRPVILYSYLAYFWPLFIAVFAIRMKSGHDLAPGKILVLIWSTMGLGLMLAQERFGEFAAPALFLITAWALVASLRRVRQALANTTRLRRWVLGVSLGLSLVVALWPLPKGIVFLYTHDPVKYQRQLWKFGQDLRHVLPSPLDSAGHPKWGMLTGWMEAHALLELTKIPVSVSSFGTSRALEGNSKSFSLMLSEDEDTVFSGMKNMHLAYMVVSNQIRQARSMALIAQISEPVVETATGIDPKGRLIKRTEPLARYLNSVSTRLWLGDSSARWTDGSIHKGLGHFRLVLESSASTPVLGVKDASNATLKAFQVVPGARLEGAATPGSQVRLRLLVKTNTSRTFTYSRKTTADQDGRFVFLVPYPTNDGPFPCKAQGPYRIKADDRVVHVEVDEQDVITQKVIDVTRIQ